MLERQARRAAPAQGWRDSRARGERAAPSRWRPSAAAAHGDALRRRSSRDCARCMAAHAHHLRDRASHRGAATRHPPDTRCAPAVARARPEARARSRSPTAGCRPASPRLSALGRRTASWRAARVTAGRMLRSGCLRALRHWRGLASPARGARAMAYRLLGRETALALDRWRDFARSMHFARSSARRIANSAAVRALRHWGDVTSEQASARRVLSRALKSLVRRDEARCFRALVAHAEEGNAERARLVAAARRWASPALSAALRAWIQLTVHRLIGQRRSCVCSSWRSQGLGARGARFTEAREAPRCAARSPSSRTTRRARAAHVARGLRQAAAAALRARRARAPPARARGARSRADLRPTPSAAQAACCATWSTTSSTAPSARGSLGLARHRAAGGAAVAAAAPGAWPALLAHLARRAPQERRPEMSNQALLRTCCSACTIRRRTRPSKRGRATRARGATHWPRCAG